MKFDEIADWASILTSSMGMIRLSTLPIPNHIPKWLEYGVTFFLMAQFIWSITLIRKNKKK